MSRLSYLFRRLVLAVPVLLFATSMTFLFIRASPIDPVAAILGPSPNQADYHRIAVQLGLERPTAGGGLGVVRTLLMGAGALAPSAVGIIADAVGFRPAFALLSGSMGLAAVVAAGLWVTE